MKNFKINLVFILIYFVNLSYELINNCSSSNRNLIKFNKSLEYVYSYEIDSFAKIKLNDHLKPASLKFKSEIKLIKLSDCDDFMIRFDKIQSDMEFDLNERIKHILNSPFEFKLIDGEIKKLKFNFNLTDEKTIQWIRTLYENLFNTLQLPLSKDVEQNEAVSLSSQENYDQCPIVYKVKTKKNTFYEIESRKNLAKCLRSKNNKFIDKFLINSNQDCNHFVNDANLIQVNCFENNKANLLNMIQVINTKLNFLKFLNVESNDENELKDDLKNKSSDELKNKSRNELKNQTSNNSNNNSNNRSNNRLNNESNKNSLNKEENDSKKNLISSNLQINRLPVFDENLIVTSKELLTKICDQLKVQIDPKITEFVLNLGRTIRKLTYNQLIEITQYSKQIEQCKDKQQFQDILHSVIFQQGNSAAIKYLLKHIDRPNDMFYSFLAFSYRPTKDAVELIIPKLEEQLNKIDTSYQSILGITSFIGNYCEENNCEQNPYIIKVQKLFIDKLGNECSSQYNKHRILLLKSIQNIGIQDQMIDQLLPCLEKSESAVRLVTLQMFNRPISNPFVIDKLKSLFADQNEESEFRIHSFLCLIKSLKFDLDLKDFLIDHLAIEQNLQILSFVESYLKNTKDNDLNLKEIANSLKSNKGTTNIFQYSKNVHLSPDFLKNNNLMNGGLNINLIRNNQNQLVNAILNSEIAFSGDEMQPIEAGFIQTGLSNLIDEFMKQLTKKSASINLQGAFEEMLNLVVSLKNDKQSIQTLVKKLVKDDNDEMNGEINDKMNDETNNKMNDKTNEEINNRSIRLVTYLKLNKRTIFLVDFNSADDNNLNSSKKQSKRSLDLNNRSILSKDYERAFVFIYLNKGYELSNPLSPIKFELTGIMIFGIKFNNQTLAPTFLNDFTTSIEIGNKDEHKLKFYSGLKVNPIFTYEIQPVDKDYVFSLLMQNDSISLIKSTNFIGEHNMQDRLTKETNHFSTCTSNLNHLIGLELCLKESKNFNQPIQKLIDYEIYLKKTDPTFKNWLTRFTFEKSKDFANNYQLYNLVILFDTPGSKQNRHFNSKVQMRKSTNKISLNGTFNNQIQKYTANLNIDTTDVNDLQSKLHLYSNDQLIAIVDFIQPIKYTQFKTEYNPSVRVFLSPTFNRPTIHLIGSLVIDLVNKNELQFNLYSRTSGTNYLKGLIKRIQNERYTVDVQLYSLPALIKSLRMSSNIQYSSNQYLSSESKFDYILYKNNLKDTIKISTKFKNTSFNALTGLSTFVSMRCTKHSNFNFDLAYNLTYKPNAFLENDFKFKYLNIKEFNLFQQYTFTRSTRNSEWIDFENTFKINLQPQQLTYQSQIALIYHPAAELFQYKLDFNLDKILNQIAMDLVKFNFDYQQVTKKPLKTYLKSILQYKNQFEVTYNDELDEIGKNEFKGQTMLKWSKNKFARINYYYLIKNEIIGKSYKVNTDFQMHHMPSPYSHQAFFEYQKTNFTLKSLFHCKDEGLWDFNLFHEYDQQFNLSLKSDYLNIKNKLTLKPFLTGNLLIDANKFLHFNHFTFLNYTNQTLFELNSLTTSKRRNEKTNFQLLDKWNEKLNNKLIANLTISQQPIQLRLNLQSHLIPSVKLNYNNHDQIKSGQFEIVDNDFQHKSTWTYTNNLHLKMRLIKQGKLVGNLGLLAENDYNQCDLKATYYNWNLDANNKFKNEGRKLIFIKLNKLDKNRNLIIDHTTNLSLAVTNGYIKSVTYKDLVKKMDFDASIQGRNSSKITFFVKDLFNFKLIFNPFIKNKFADLEINEDANEMLPNRKYLTARLEYDPKSFELNTNYFNQKLTFHKQIEQSSIKLEFLDLKYLGKCSHLLILNKNFTQYSLKQYSDLKNDSTEEISKQIDLKFVSKKEFYINVDYLNKFKVETNVNLNNKSVYLNLKKQPNQIEFKIESYNYVLIDFKNEQISKHIKLLTELNDEYKSINYVHKDLSTNYEHETKIYLFENYDMNAKIETINQFLFELNYKLWQEFDLTYRKPTKEVRINLIKNQLYLVQLKEKNELYKIEFKENEITNEKITIFYIKSIEFIHETHLIFNEPNNNNVHFIKLISNHSESSRTNSNKVLDLNLMISKTRESQLLVDYHHYNLNIKMDPFVERKIILIYKDKNKQILSSSELAYLGLQTYHMYSNITTTEDNRMPFQFSLIAIKKKPTQFRLIKDDYQLEGEFNFMKLSKQTAVIKIKNDVDKLYGNITLESNPKAFLIANYILLDQYATKKGQANLIIAMVSSEIVKFNYNDDSRTIFTQLLWLGDRIALKSEVNHTDYNHKLTGFLSYDPSKTIKLNFNKTFNLDSTFKGDLVASLAKPSYLYVDQIDFGNLNVTVNLVDKKDHKISFDYFQDQQSAINFLYTKQNPLIHSNLMINLQKLHPLLLINLLFNMTNEFDSKRSMKSIFNLDLLEPDYKTNLNSDFSFDEDVIEFKLLTESLNQFLPTINSKFSLSGLSSKSYVLDTNWTVNNHHKFNSIYRHKEYLNAEYTEGNQQYQTEFKRSISDSSISSFIRRRIVNGKTTIIGFDLKRFGNNNLNSSISLEHLNRKTTFAFTKLDDEQIENKKSFIFEIIFDEQKSKRKIYDLKLIRINNDLIQKETITLNNSNLNRPFLIDFEKKKDNLALKWNLQNNQSDNELKVNFRNLEFTEMYKIIKTIVSYNEKPIIGLDLEKNFETNDLTKLNMNFFNSSLRLEDTFERLIFNVNNNDLTLQVDKEHSISLESQFKANKLNQKIIIYYDVQNKAISYQDFNLESFRNLSTQFWIKPIPLTSSYISILNIKDEINNEIFLLQINATDSNRRKFLLKHNEIYLFSRQFIRKQKKIFNQFLNEILLNTKNSKFTIQTYLASEMLNSLNKFNQDLKEDLNRSFNSIIEDWPMVNKFIENLNKNYLNAFLIQLNSFIENLMIKFKRKFNAISQETEILKEYSIEMFNIIFESFEDQFIRFRKFLFKFYNLAQSFLDRQIYQFKSYIPENYWNLIDNLWSILLSTDFWQTKLPVINSNSISFYF